MSAQMAAPGCICHCTRERTPFVPTSQVAVALEQAQVPPDQVQHMVGALPATQLGGLKPAILAAGGITLCGFALTRYLPARRLGAEDAADDRRAGDRS